MPVSHPLPPLLLSRSPALTVVLAVMHAGAIVCVWLVPLPPFLRASILVALAFSAYRAIRRHGLRVEPRAIIALKDGGDRRCARRRADSDWQACEIQSLFVHPALTLVRVIVPQGATTVVIAADAVDRGVFRDWRRRLAWMPSSARPPDGLDRNPE